MRSNSYCILLIALFEITSTLSEPRSSQSRSLIPNSRRSRQSTSSTPDPPDPAAASEETERSQLQNGQEDLSVSESQLNPVYYKELPPNSAYRNRLAQDILSQRRNEASSSYKVPPVPVDNRVTEVRLKPAKLKSEYYPPAVREMPRVSHMEAECSDDVMKLRIKFNATFAGLIYSAGYSYDNDCIYINGTGEDEYEFYIQLNRCGTLGGSDHNKKRNAPGYKNTDPTKNYMWNTVTIQYNPLIEEEWDEHFKVTCEYGYDFWKTVTFPFLDVEVNTENPVHFTLSPPACHMEIREGYGTGGQRVAKPVHVGDPLTLMIFMRSQWDGFDILVNDCYAHNGANKKIQLIDHHGCPVDTKLISKFQGNIGMNNNLAMYETLIYAHMKTFRFTGTPALYIECDIRMCHGRCPTQSCDWRNPSRRRRRDLSGDDDLSNTRNNSTPLATSAESLSENLSLFQAIHVLQSEEEERSYNNQTDSSSLKSDGPQASVEDQEDTICIQSMMFASVIGSLSMVTLLSSVILALMCLKVKGQKDSDDNLDGRDFPPVNRRHISTRFTGLLGHTNSSPARSMPASRNGPTSMPSSTDTMRSRKSEYIHTSQTRIP